MRRVYLGSFRLDVDMREHVRPALVAAGVGRPAMLLSRVAAAALEEAGAPRPASLGLVLADDEELAALNAEHMGTQGPTDVLSFPLLPPGAFPPHGGAPHDDARAAAAARFALPPGSRPHLGDVVISVERAIEQAAEGRGGQTGDVRWSARDELRLLAVHGTLHVCGWDHAAPAEEAAMRGLERRILGLHRS